MNFTEVCVCVCVSHCRSPASAMRCSMLQCEVLKERGMYRHLTQICIKMTSEVTPPSLTPSFSFSLWSLLFTPPAETPSPPLPPPLFSSGCYRSQIYTLQCVWSRQLTPFFASIPQWPASTLSTLSWPATVLPRQPRSAGQHPELRHMYLTKIFVA